MHNPAEYTVEYRDVKHPRLEFKTGTLLIVLPKTGWTPDKVLEKYSKWIKRKQITIDSALKQTAEKTVVTGRTDSQLKTLIRRYAESSQKELKTKINRIYFKKMKTKWASYSQSGNLTINTLMKYLPENLIEYVTFHEIAHSIERKHNERFWNMIYRKFSDASAKEGSLFSYWFMIQETSEKK